MGGTAKDFYESGIRLAFEENGITDQSIIDEYINRTEVKDVDYTDPFNGIHNIKGRVKVDVKWNEADTDELKLEKIITQKYIALFPYSFEAWTEMRRTGYPKTLPVLNWEDADANLQEGDLLRRMRFPGTDTQAVAADVAATGLKALGGADLQSTRIWWDVEGTPNF